MSAAHGRTALVGHTGFVGSNLAASAAFDDVYNSTTIGDIRGQHYDLVVSAAGRADSHRINEHGEQDRRELDELIDHLCHAEIGKLVLVSTVCVYPGGTTPDESSPVSGEGLLPYGRNRVHVERVVSARMDTLIVRLPQLYGRNMKKGIVYDLANDYRIEHIRPRVCFQLYHLARLWHDIETALDRGLAALNIATPPLSCGRIARDVFGRDLGPGEDPGPDPYTKDMRTRYSALFDGPPGYLHSAERELAELRSFIEHPSDQ